MDNFYVQDKRQYVGNCILWWRKGGGYTTFIDQAEVFTEETLPTDRSTDVPWPKEHVDQHIKKVVDVQYLDNPLRGDVRYMNPRVPVATKQEISNE